MRRTPGTECRRGLAARIGVDGRRHARRPARRQFEREAAGGGSPATPSEDPLGQEPSLDSERLEGGNLLGLGRQPRQVRMPEHVVELEEAPHEEFRGRDPGAAVVPRLANRFVGRASTTPGMCRSIHSDAYPYREVRVQGLCTAPSSCIVSCKPTISTGRYRCQYEMTL